MGTTDSKDSKDSQEKLKNLMSEEKNVEFRILLHERSKRIRTLYYVFVPILALYISVFLILIHGNGEKKFVEKTTVKVVLRNVINNGGELNSVKHIYNTRYIEDVFFWPFSEKRKNYYTNDYPLSGILNDLLVDYLQNTQAKDSLYHRRLCNIIAENEKQNPFDNLEDNQKYSFENIQVKLDSMYSIITPDVLKIAEELNDKNQLVDKYLNKSDISFYLSISALILTLLLSGFQIYQNYNTYKVFQVFLKQNNNKPEQKEDSKRS